MVATQKVESENEDTQEKVRARVTMITDPGEGTAKLGKQIAKLMTALTQNGQDSGPSSAPGSPQEHGCWCGHSGRGTPSHLNSHYGRGGLGQMTLAYSLPTDHGVEGIGSWSNGSTCLPTATWTWERHLSSSTKLS